MNNSIFKKSIQKVQDSDDRRFYSNLSRSVIMFVAKYLFMPCVQLISIECTDFRYSCTIFRGQCKEIKYWFCWTWLATVSNYKKEMNWIIFAFDPPSNLIGSGGEYVRCVHILPPKRINFLTLKIVSSTLRVSNRYYLSNQLIACFSLALVKFHLEKRTNELQKSCWFLFVDSNNKWQFGTSISLKWGKQ